MDEGIGNFTAALSAKKMLEETFIIFTTDNGGPVPDTPGGDYVGSRNYPLRGGKHSKYTAQHW
jgi:arylsulfatase A-like enzyme